MLTEVDVVDAVRVVGVVGLVGFEDERLKPFLRHFGEESPGGHSQECLVRPGGSLILKLMVSSLLLQNCLQKPLKAILFLNYAIAPG